MTPTGNSASTTIEGSVIYSAPEIANGRPVFRGTRVPVRTLFDRLSGDDGLDGFLENFPTVNRDQAVRAIHMARAMLEMYAYGDEVRLDGLCEGESSSTPSVRGAPPPPSNSVIDRDADTMWGTPVFKGSRMPMRSLFDHLAGGYTITGFLSCFDTVVTPQQARRAIGMASEALESYVNAPAVR